MDVEPEAGAVRLDRGIPLQVQIFSELRAELLDGLWVGRTGFYTEKELSERFGVSLITARAVLDRLAEEGWIRRARGRRSLPLRGPSAAQAWTDVPLVTGGPRVVFEYELVSARVDVAPADACRALDREPGASLWQCVRVRRLKGRVHSVTQNVQDPVVGARHAPASLGRRPMIAMLAEQGQRAAVLRRQISAVAPPPFAAQLLGLSLGTPALLYTCTLHRADDSVIEWLRVYVHPDTVAPPEAFDLETGRWLTLVRP